MQEKKIILLGLPESGKTSYIAAFWNFVNSDMNQKALMLNTLRESEDTYLNQIAGEWLKFQRVTRTNTNDSRFEVVTMNLIRVEDNTNIILEIPDLSGEIIKSHFSSGTWAPEFEALVNSVNGIMIFINPNDRNNVPRYIYEAMELEALFDDKLFEKVNTHEKKYSNYADWSDDNTSNQVKLVESLQYIDYRRFSGSVIKLVVAISAWDLVDKHNAVIPIDWLKEHMPLLFQYIKSNKNIFEVKVIGISAQGLDYEKEDEMNDAYTKKAYERSYYKEGEYSLTDITQPIVWLSK